MTDEKTFRTPNQELADLATEIKGMRELLRDVSNRLSQIERHVKRAFPALPETKPHAKSRATQQGEGGPPTLTPEEALRLFDELAGQWRDTSRASVEERLASLSLPDLKVLTQQLGLSFSSKPSRKTLQSGVIRRINESVMLSRNVNVTPPRSEDPGGAKS